MKIFDAHGDIWCDVLRRRSNGETDIIMKYHASKFERGHIFSGIFVVWVDTPQHEENKRMHDIIAAMQDELDENSQHLKVVKKFEDFSIAERENKLPIVLGVEGFDGFQGDIRYITKLYDMGFRHASLTWNHNNAFAGGVRGDVDTGLTSLGIEALKILENKGMIIDLSHASEKTFWDIEKHTKGILIASHSNAKALCNVPRNLTDDQIKAISDRNGVIGAVAYHEFISSNKEQKNIHRFVDHIEYLVNLVGINHVGLGFDFTDYLNSDALNTFSEVSIETEGLTNASEASGVIQVLEKRGYNNEAIEKICSGNFLRVIKDVVG